MTLNDLFYVIQWYLIITIIGILFLPLTTRLFSNFLDRGYAFSKIIGWIIVSYIIFFFGTLKIIPFTPAAIYAIALSAAVINYYLFRKDLKILLSKNLISIFLVEEIFFFICLTAWSYVRGFNPEIFGLEKYMDYGFVNSILRSTFFPPKDMWYSPLPINYYYFGHLITAVLTKASSLPSYITYNLMIATLFAVAFIESFSLGINLLWNARINIQKLTFRIFFGGFLIACLITISGNLHVIYSFFKTYDTEKPVPFWNMQFALYNPCYGKVSFIQKNTNGKTETITCPTEEQTKLYSFPNAYWYPNATRFIYHTIHEFPIYSWVVADLHGHVADIPAVLLVISTLFSLLISYNKQKLQNNNLTNQLIFTFLPVIGFLLAVMYMTNAWDGLTYLMLTLFILTYIQFSRVLNNKHNQPAVRNSSSFMQRYKLTAKLNDKIQNNQFIYLPVKLFIYIFIILISYSIFSLPFSSSFDPSKIVTGIGVLNAPSILLEHKNIGFNNYGADQRDLISKVLIPDHCKSSMSPSDAAKVTTQYDTRKIGPLLFEPDHCQRSPWWQLLILYGFFYFFVIAYFIYIKSRKTYLNKLAIKQFSNKTITLINTLSPSDIFIIILVIVSTILIVIPEFFYMKDIYPEHYRANTMFKLVFQAFIMLSASSGYIIIKTISKNVFKILTASQKLIYMAYFVMTVILLTLVFMYPYFAVTSYYNNLKNYLGLNGLMYLKAKNPDDYEAINWLNKNIPGQPFILEAQGDSYTDYERISANSGLPTVLGWYVHEWLWRGQDAPVQRAEDVRTIYESTDISKTADLIHKYNISYIILGSLERQKYPNLNTDILDEIAKPVFRRGTVTIYKVN